MNYSSRFDEINKLADAIEQRKSELQKAAALDAGFPVKVTALEVDLAVQHLRTMEEELPWVENARPYGMVAAILPYDAPVVVLARLGGSALLTGNRLRFSFSSQTPRTAALIAEISAPFKSFEPIIGRDNREFGRSCVADESVRVLFISGASGVGKAYRRDHQSFDKLFFAGPGGMPAAVVFKDADAGAASRFIARRAFVNAGQYCTTLKKVLIHRDLYEEVRDGILEMVSRMKVGDPFDVETELGPVKVERTRLIIENAMSKFSAARVLTGAVKGELIYPLVLETMQRDIPDLELFGPFLLLKPFEDPEGAVEELTRTRYGFLLTYFGTPSESAKQRFHAHFGMVHANPDFYFTPLRLPFGGKKESGWILERREGQWVERDGAFLYSKELVRNGSEA